MSVAGLLFHLGRSVWLTFAPVLGRAGGLAGRRALPRVTADDARLLQDLGLTPHEAGQGGAEPLFRAGGPLMVDTARRRPSCGRDPHRR